MQENSNEDMVEFIFESSCNFVKMVLPLIISLDF